MSHELQILRWQLKRKYLRNLSAFALALCIRALIVELTDRALALCIKTLIVETAYRALASQKPCSIILEYIHICFPEYRIGLSIECLAECLTE